MEINKRVQDVTKVFDDRWNVNHDYAGRKAIIDDRKEHFNKMFNIKPKEDKRKEILRANSVNGKVESLNKRMDAANFGMQMARKNDIKNKFR